MCYCLMDDQDNFPLNINILSDWEDNISQWSFKFNNILTTAENCMLNVKCPCFKFILKMLHISR